VIDIEYQSDAFRKECENKAKMLKKRGEKRAKLIQQRLSELRAANCLEDIRHLPGPRLHQHTRKHGQKKAIFSVDLDHPYRLFFTASADPEPSLPGGGVDWKLVTAVLIIGIEDPHGN